MGTRGRGSNSLSGFARVAKAAKAAYSVASLCGNCADRARPFDGAGAERLASLLPLLADPDPEIRGQAAWLL